VVGGLHLPVHAAGTALMPQAVLGNPHPPWHPISEHDADRVLDEIQACGPRLVALSGHDSTPWTFTAFASRFGDRYRSCGPERKSRSAQRQQGEPAAVKAPAAEGPGDRGAQSWVSVSWRCSSRLSGGTLPDMPGARRRATEVLWPAGIGHYPWGVYPGSVAVMLQGGLR
jgi:hypothetical protein